MLAVLGQIITVGAHAVGVATHATPALQGESLTEVYLTQPAMMADARLGPFQFNGMLNFEGWTLRRGELNAGVWGEGYVDRRHPHTFLHEAMLTIQTSFSGGDVSFSGGRGFAPFGTDDPMVRSFVKYPANHHLSQILERLVASAAVRRGPVVFEAAVFSGAEPTAPEDLGDIDHLGDSWSGRVTLRPRAWLELQASYAEVTSPENPSGAGLDHQMWNTSARVERSLGANTLYFLAETGETKEHKGGFDYFFYDTFLAEAAISRADWQLALRFERSVRPEEERQANLFRAVRPHIDNSILGTTRWTSGGLQLSRSMPLHNFRLRPFVEVFRLHAAALEEFPVITPEVLYGASDMWSFSLGIRSTVGGWHGRMGRYGAAVAPNQHHH